MKSLLAILLLMLSPIIFLSSCLEEEKFDTPADATLRFSVDTIDLDTVITHMGSATKRFTIYNDNSKGISITSISIVGDKGFLANVDGTNITGTLPTSIDCRGKDSLIAHVQYTAQDVDADTALVSEARLVFTLSNGKQKSVVLQGQSLDAIVLKGKVVKGKETLDATRPYLIYDSLVVDQGATLTIAPGTTLLFYTDIGLKVKGTLIAQGTLDKPITMRGHRYDNMFKYQTYDHIDNQWLGVTFCSSSYDNKLNFCDIHSSKYGIHCDSSDITRQKLLLENSIVHNTKEDVLFLNNCKSFVANTQISNSEGNCITVYGGYNEFVHCTVASFSPFTALRGYALVFYNYSGEVSYPIKLLAFYNSIITGYASDEVYAYTKDDYDNNYAFYNCLINTPEINDNPSVIGNIWEDSKSEVRSADNFIPFDLKTLTYDFHLSEKSFARGNADVNLSKKYGYTTDREGRTRIGKDTPCDIGCYQYIPIAQ